MSSIIGDLLTNRIRSELRNRVEQILKAGEEWSKAARELTEALDRLTEAIKNGGVDKSAVRSVVSKTSRLSRETKKLTRAFEMQTKTLEKALAKIGA